MGKRKLELGTRGAERLEQQRTTEDRKAKEEMDRREQGLWSWPGGGGEPIPFRPGSITGNGTRMKSVSLRVCALDGRQTVVLDSLLR